MNEIYLWRALALFLLFGALSGVALGALLIARPAWLARVNRVANRWVSTRHLHQFLDRMVSIEHWFYLHHRMVGAAVVLGAAYLFIHFGLLFDKAAALRHLSHVAPTRLLDGLLDALVLSALLGAAVALLVGLFLWLRPSLLRGIEEQANRWLSLRRATRPLEIPRDHVERFVARHAQSVGWLLLLGSIYLIIALLRLLA
ncbi:MAG TPA: hypothetical protein VFW53_00950 [Gallionella sp.]|nr:hypothetical protein [Gallionella sp.]